jgi:hypothetical protein
MAIAELDQDKKLPDLRAMLARQDGQCDRCQRVICHGEPIAKPADSYVVVCLPCFEQVSE